MDQVERCLLSRPVERRVQRQHQHLGMDIPIPLAFVLHVHTNGPRKGLYHPFRTAVGLWSIRKCRPLLLADHLVERTKHLRHEPGFPVVSDDLACSEPPEYAPLVGFGDRLGLARSGGLHDQKTRVVIHPDQELGISPEGCRQR